MSDMASCAQHSNTNKMFVHNPEKQAFWGLFLTCEHDDTITCSCSGKRLSKPFLCSGTKSWVTQATLGLLRELTCWGKVSDHKIWGDMIIMQQSENLSLEVE